MWKRCFLASRVKLTKVISTQLLGDWECHSYLPLSLPPPSLSLHLSLLCLLPASSALFPPCDQTFMRLGSSSECSFTSLLLPVYFQSCFQCTAVNHWLRKPVRICTAFFLSFSLLFLPEHHSLHLIHHLSSPPPNCCHLVLRHTLFICPFKLCIFLPALVK